MLSKFLHSGPYVMLEPVVSGRLLSSVTLENKIRSALVCICFGQRFLAKAVKWCCQSILSSDTDQVSK